ncbi:MAG: glycine oxidase ThiO [Acidobacteria bacterium]|jgi:glycine oxidase|nr:glycine oxidase ThiO [Acidobacteriota bacterium]
MNLSKNQDILIVGGGIIGLSLARSLRNRGVDKITILEQNECGREASHAAAGMLAPQAEADCADDFFRFCQESRDLYPQFAEDLFSETGVDVELDRTGTLYLAFTEKDAEELENRYTWQKNANLSVEKLTAKEVLEIEPNVSPDVLFGLRFPLDWQVENRKIIEALIKLLPKQKGSVQKPVNSDGSFSGKARRLLLEGDRITGVETDLGVLSASIVVIASGAWTSLIEDKFNLLSDIKIKPMRGQMLAFNDNYKLFRHVIYSPRGYLVPRKNNRILVGATVEDVGFDNHTTGLGTVSLLNTAFEIAPEFKNLSLKKTWAGLRPLAADGLPVIGAIPEIENLFVATAHYRNGILLAPKTAEILADKIVGNADSKYLEIFSPRRFRSEAILS